MRIHREASLPDHARDSLYDIEPLRPFIEANYVLLTPNFRLARRIKSVWDDSELALGKSLWSPLKVYALENWLRDRWQRAIEVGLIEPKLIIGEGHASQLWQQVIAEHQASSNTYSLLRVSAAATLASQARETLLRWQTDITTTPVHREFTLDEDCSSYLAWQALFQARLAADGLITQADAISQLYAVAPDLPLESIALLDFDDIPPLYRACIESSASDLETLNSRAGPGRCLAHTFPDKRTELTAVARWAQQIHQQNPHDRIGIILPNTLNDRIVMEQSLRKAFACQGENYYSLPVNFSAGTPAGHVPLVRDALRIFEFVRPRVSVADTVAILQSRFVDLPDAGSAIALKFTSALFNDGIAEVDTGQLRYSASQVSLNDNQGLALGRYLMTMSQMRELRASHLPSQWRGILCELLDLWGWPGRGTLDSVEYQQIDMWQQLLDDFCSYDCVTGPVSAADALSLLRQCAGRHVFQPKTADSSIQVLGMLEGAGLQFDHLWLCGLQGNALPAPVRPNPFIPIAMQRRLAMPHASVEREWQFASSLMQHYVQGAPEVHGSYVQQIDGIPELPSSVLKDFEWIDEPLTEPGADNRWRAQRESLHLEARPDDNAPAVSPAEAATLGGGSSLLEDQSHCPFRAFTKRRLNTHPLGDFEVGLSAATRGSILHDALYALWGTIGDSKTLATVDNTSLEQWLVDAAGAAIAAIAVRLRAELGEAYLQLEQQRLISLLKEWLAVERQRSAFIVQAREQDCALTIAPLEIRLRVDRIDQLPDGSQVIIDYKSGRSSVRDWLGDRPSKPQLLLYGLAANSDTGSPAVAALSFAQVRPRDCSFVGIGREPAAPGIRDDVRKLTGDLEDWDSLNTRWREILEALVAGFINGEARIDPLSPSSCNYCGLEALCRIGDVREATS